MVFANKKLFINKSGDIHVGIGSPEGFSECNIADVKKILKNLGDKKLWRCHVCNDLSISKIPLELCPTCFQKDAYVEINENEFRGLLKI